MKPWQIQDKKDALNKLIVRYGDRLVHEMLSVFDPEIQTPYHEHGIEGFGVAERTRLSDRAIYLVKYRIVLAPRMPQAPNPCGKARYQKEALANTVANDIWNDGRGQMRVYACPRCEGWHLTHKPLLED